MKTRSDESPFAGCSTEDIHARWTVWSKSETDMQEARASDVEAGLQAVAASAMRGRHPQYDAVLKRMKSATGRAGTYTAVTL